ncbi:TonB system transport protein ExbD [Campylobacter sp. RM12640]|nr:MULTISPECIES: TonB system transport protein ExbD [unclassified Campylobacter]MBZ7976278.1 TonB system transport protein ExbD [Campylobacter sp. RM12637]MBZ7979645.1 TonB system transport protein ExbD [Campylobacter sp. RM12642]MBZ7981575.1 TonB system transport protein ExbD [Campylobacter sp. RM12640]MBZ7988450.1 TonB system transport protein ExbD [Campylobacter sp. RM12635]MBZ7992948.1 TonB system transport protein ExbD [Campylobacter sp. RM9333]MBZ8007329.1 TonB system transport protein 
MRVNKEGLNLVPFIDIMLVLLCIVLSVSTFIAEEKIAINLPKSENSVSIDDKQKVFISINETGEIFYNESLLSVDELKTKLSSISKDEIVILRSDENASYKHFVKIVDILKELKHENFAIATEK